MSSPELVKIDVADGVGTLTLADTKRLNAFGLPLAEQALAALQALRDAPRVRAVVLRGEGRVFSVGGDVRQMGQDIADGDPGAFFREPLSAFNALALALHRLPKPVLVAVHGAVAGVAFNLMLACDLALAAASTRFTQAFVSIGLSADGGGTWMLPRRVGRARACELTLLPTTLDADTACRWGLVNWVVPDAELEAETRRRAAQLATGPTQAIARTKALLNAAYDRSLADQAEQERLAQLENSAHPDFAEGIAAFLEKRPPVFRG
jgi:2-(1,2-epoxy-1,2-dihydrophenyl)acetyl-CoA isomerase